jgi:hypothetical protein
MKPPDPAAYAARLERVRAATLEARRPPAPVAEVAAADDGSIDETPPVTSSVGVTTRAPISRSDELDDLPPPPVVLVHRLGESAAPPPLRQNGRRMALGIDPLDDIEIPRGLKSSIERVVGGLAEDRDAD